MSQYLKDQLPTFLVGALVAVLLFVVVRKKPDSEASILTKFQVDQLKAEMKGVILHEFDSLRTVVTAPVETTNAHADSLREIEHAENNKIIYELRKKRNATIDTMGSVELRRIFAEYGRQYPNAAN